MSSVASVVLSVRFGNPIPLILVVGGTVSLLLISRKVTTTFPKMVFDILSWVAAAYLSVIVFFVLLPFGLIIGMLGLGLTLLSFSAIKDSYGFGEKLSFLLDQTTALTPQIPLIGASLANEKGHFWQTIGVVSIKAFLLPRIHRDLVVEILHERPYLPLSLTRYADVDILFVRPQTDSGISEQITGVLADLGVCDLQELSPFMTRAIVSLPLLEEREAERPLDNYRLATSESTVKRLVEIWPDRMTIIPHKEGPFALIRSETAPGFEMTPLPQGHELGVILNHETEHVETGDVPIAAESAT